MKKHLLCSALASLLFTACTKESSCIKGQIIDINPCSRTWGVQILNGPEIGTLYGAYDNVIELFDVPFESKAKDDVFLLSLQPQETTGVQTMCINLT